MDSVSVLRIHLFKHSHQSFLTALDIENIPHHPLHQFTSRPQASSFVECISTIFDKMPWNSLAKVMITWINARRSREIIVTTSDMKIIHLKGYSVTDAEKIIKLARDITVIDTKNNINE